MKCPKCGAFIEDGKLYCEKCGAEIELVTDIDMELEMKHTMSGIAKEQFSQDEIDYNDIDFDDDDNPSIIALLFKAGSKIGKIFYIFVALIFVVVIVVAVRMGIKINHENSLEFQLEKAEEAKENDDLAKAIEYLEKASKMDPSISSYKFTVAEYYEALGKIDDAVYTLTEIAENPDFIDAERVQAYRKLFALLKEEGNYTAISTTLEKCDLKVIKDEYSAYTIAAPTFSVPEGTYKDKVTLTIKGNGTDIVYYTLDGSDPLGSGTEYSEPISLEYGSYTIKAVSVNDYGLASQIVTANYLIDVAFSFSPKVEPEDGEFEHSFMIEVEVPVMYTCYYTTDGSDPTKESTRYSGPIPAAEGDNTYKFVVFASDGTMSEIVEKHYVVTLNTEITAADAVTKLNQNLIDRGYLDESGCHREGVDGTYIFMYSTIYPVEEMGDFYFVVEYIQDDFGNNKMTGTYYAIDCYNGMLYTVDVTGEDGFVLSPL